MTAKASLTNSDMLPYFRLAYHIENCRHNGVYEPWRDRLNAAYFLRAQPASPIQLLDVWVRLAADRGAEALRPGNFTTDAVRGAQQLKGKVPVSEPHLLPTSVPVFRARACPFRERAARGESRVGK